MMILEVMEISLNFLIFKGVDEPLNETEAIRTSQLAIFTATSSGAALQRQLSLLHNNPPLLAFSTASSVSNWVNAFNTNFTALNA
jgi:hypothetical protein